jgi:hypothetical protein
VNITKLNIPGPPARAVLAHETATISPSYPRDYPCVMDHGRGSEVWGVDGNRYIDRAAGIATCAIGHCHPEVVATIQGEGRYIIPLNNFLPHLCWQPPRLRRHSPPSARSRMAWEETPPSRVRSSWKPWPAMRSRQPSVGHVRGNGLMGIRGKTCATGVPRANVMICPGLYPPLPQRA